MIGESRQRKTEEGTSNKRERELIRGAQSKKNEKVIEK